MPVFFKELKRGKWQLIIWTAGVSFLLAVTVFLFLIIEPVMSSFDELYAQFGIDPEDMKMDFATYFSAEFSEMMALTGAIFAAILSAGLLSGEERAGTAEFLLIHPVPRRRIALEKLLFAVANLVVFSAVAFAVTFASTAAIGERVGFGKLLLLFTACLIVLLEISAVCFLRSALGRGNGIGFALGFTLGTYVLGLIASATDKLKFLSFFTPYSLCSAGILETGTLDWKYCIVWPVLAVASAVLALYFYEKKDIYG